MLIYKQNGYGIRLDFRSEFSLPDGNMRKNVIVFGADMSSSVISELIIDDKGKDVLALGEGPTHSLDDTT